MAGILSLACWCVASNDMGGDGRSPECFVDLAHGRYTRLFSWLHPHYWLASWWGLLSASFRRSPRCKNRPSCSSPRCWLSSSSGCGVSLVLQVLMTFTTTLFAHLPE